MIDVSASWEDIITMFVDKVKEFVKVLVVVEGCVEVEEGWVDARAPHQTQIHDYKPKSDSENTIPKSDFLLFVQILNKPKSYS